MIVLAASSEHRNTRPGEEHGSARWGNAKELNRRYRDTQGPNLLMTRNIRIGVDGYKPPVEAFPEDAAEAAVPATSKRPAT